MKLVLGGVAHQFRATFIIYFICYSQALIHCYKLQKTWETNGIVVLANPNSTGDSAHFELQVQFYL